MPPFINRLEFSVAFLMLCGNCYYANALGNRNSPLGTSASGLTLTKRSHQSMICVETDTNTDSPPADGMQTVAKLPSADAVSN